MWLLKPYRPSSPIQHGRFQPSFPPTEHAPIMASITYDAQSFMIDGRRIWIVSGSVHYARVPREHWAARIHAARQAGLNAIETPIFWARHEPRQGMFDFTGDNDIRRFVELVGEAGMYCILRPGPYVGTGYDMGGLPPWLVGISGIGFRTNSQPFLEASSRYITALAQQVRDLQITSPGKGGPILLIQNESAWTCGHDDLAHAYLGELIRYYRESGLTVPIINSNDLWQSMEAEIDCWTGFDDMLPHLRQLAVVRETQPRLVIDFRVGRSDYWGHPLETSKTPQRVLRRLAEVLASGGQYNISPFFGGTNFGFSGGRLAGVPDAFITTSSDRDAPLNEVGLPSSSYSVVRRISTFASRFARILAHLDPRRACVALHPAVVANAPHHSSKGGAAPTPLSVVHAWGSQGSVVFVFGDETGTLKTQPGALLLPDGSTLPFDLGSQPVAWFLQDARISGRAQLDYTNLSAFANVGRVLILFGPAGTRGVVSINGSPLEVDIPKGASPTTIDHEGVLLVIASDEQIDTIHLDGDSVLIGVAGVLRGGEVIPHPDHKQYVRIEAEGASVTHKAHVANGKQSAGAQKKKTSSHAPFKINDWAIAHLTEYADGSSARYAAISGPTNLNALGAPYGYGWYRARFKGPSAKKHHVLFPGSGDRLHLTLDGEPAGVVGRGPGATNEGLLQLKKSNHTLVVLAENLGSASAGVDLGTPAGLCDHAWSVAPVRADKPKIVHADPIDLMGFRAPLWHVHKGDMSDAARLTWTISHKRKTPLFVRMAPVSGSGLILLNGTPVHYFERASSALVYLDAERLTRGNNVIQITMNTSTEQHAAELTQAVSFAEGVDNLTAKAEWAFASWDLPSPSSFASPSQKDRRDHGPVWWRGSFFADDSDEPVWFEATGLTKGQIYLNGRHVGRYFVATPDGKSVPPQLRYLLPRPWLDTTGANDLMIFDEHGGNATKTRLVVGAGVNAFG